MSFLGRFHDSLKDNNVNFNSADIEKALEKSCKDAKGKDNRFVSKHQKMSLPHSQTTGSAHKALVDFVEVLLKRFCKRKTTTSSSFIIRHTLAFDAHR